MKLKHIDQLERATASGRSELAKFGIALLFIVGVMFHAAFSGNSLNPMLVAAAMIGGYMALNIGANDVANNVGPAVGSKALTLAGALLIAAIFEATGALVAGGDVVATIRSGIIDPSALQNRETFIWLMMAALLAGAVWLNLATAIGAPVSTTHSIVGAVLGAGIAAAGMDAANWGQVGTIAASWVISPLLGGIIAAGFLMFIKRRITYQNDMIAAARRNVPILVAIMAWVFSTYLMLKGLKHLWKVGFGTATAVGFGIAALTYLVVRPLVARKILDSNQPKNSVNTLFTLPLIFSAALLSFAHGANDVANAVGPLAAIADALARTGAAVAKASIPVWVMMVGAIGISLGLALFGPRVIRTVGSEITELDKMRAFCVAMSATLTVIVASQLGLPVSSTHIAVGGVFGVGFLREYLKRNYDRMLDEIRAHHAGADAAEVAQFLAAFNKAGIRQKGEMLAALKARAAASEDALLSQKERKGLRKVYRRELVKRSQLFRIAAAWIITVPASALLAALLFYTLRGALMP